MTNFRDFIRRHPATAYFSLTFLISWGGVLIVLLSADFGLIPGTREQFDNLRPVAISLMLVGPVVAGFALTGIVLGRPGFRSMLSKLLKWPIDARWVGVSLLTAPLQIMAVLTGLSLFSPAFLPGIFVTSDRASLLAFGVTVGLAAGFFEELGWTGFAVPALRRRQSVLVTGIIVGVLWGAWHVFATVVFASGTYAGELSPPLFMAARIGGLLLGALPAYGVLMVWVYERTGSLLVAIVMHVSLTTSTIILEPIGISGMNLLICDLVSAAAWWALIATIAVAGRRGARPMAALSH